MRSGATVSSLLERRVLAVDEQHHPDERRDEDDDQIGAGEELLVDHDPEHDRGQQAAERVDRRPPAPAGLALAPPVPDHPDLAQREAHEHADRVERDQRMGVAAERPQQPECDGRQQHDAPRVGQPVAAERELAGHVAVLGQDRGQSREGVEARVRGEEQDERGAGGEGHEQGRSLAECRPRRHRDDRLAAGFGRAQAVLDGEQGQADEQDAEQDRHGGHRVGRVLRLGRLERRDAVGDGLDAGQRDGAAGEGLEQEQDRRSVRGGSAAGRARHRSGRDLARRSRR